MANYISLDEIKALMDKAPHHGTAKESLFRIPGNHVNELVSGDGYSLLVTTKHKLIHQSNILDPEIELLGYKVTLWVKPGGVNQQASGVVQESTGLDELIKELYKEASNRCPHNKYKWTRTLGRCYNEYRCSDCGELFTIDSTD